MHKHKLGLWLIFTLILVGLLTGAGLKPVRSASPMKVVIKPLTPFVIKKGDHYEGFSIELWEVIAKHNGWQFDYVWKETVKDLLTTVENKEADIGIAGISMTKEREQKLDFSFPMFNSGLQILTGVESSYSAMGLLTGLFTESFLQVIVAMLVIIIVAGHVVWLTERRTNPNFPQTYFRGVWEGIWWAGVNLPIASVGERQPRTVVGRMAGLGWVFMCLILVTHFMASVTTDLTVQSIRGGINGLDDLPDKRVVTVDATTSAKTLDALNIRYVAVKKIDDAFELLNRGEADAIVYDAPVLMYYTMTGGRGHTKLVGSIFHQELYGIALPANSLLREDINRTLLEIMSDGTYSKIYEKWFGQRPGEP